MNGGGEPVRWGILGTGGIAHRSFLPALREVPEARAEAVASRSAERARRFQEAEGVARAYGSYDALLEDPSIEAVYVALPNHLHAPWTIRALRAGKAVLCEKPLGMNPDEVTAMVAASKESGRPLWEAFVFPFQEQYRRIRQEVSRIGRVRRLEGAFVFTLNEPDNVRWTREWGGGAIYDVGCYPAHLARLLLGTEPVDVRGSLRRGKTGVDVEATAVIRFPDDVVMTLNCGFDGPYDTFFRIIGDGGQLRVENPYHQRAAETIMLGGGDGGIQHIHLTSDVSSFTPALRHIGAVIRGQETPEHLAEKDALGTSRLLGKLLALPSV